MDALIELCMSGSLIVLLIIASVMDIRHRIIPDWATLGFGLLFVGLRVALPTDPWWDAFLAMFITFVGLALVSIQSKGGIGGGDVKLFSVVALVLGTMQIMNAILLSYLFAMLFAIWRKVTQKKPLNAEIAFGPFIAIGVWVTWSIQFIT